jgi:23S rRNA pseudouridine1911/1915/1917 synthase
MFRAGFATDSPITNGERLDHYLVRRGWASSRSIASKLIEDGRVRVNGRHQRKGALITANDRVEVTHSLGSPRAEPDLESKVIFEILYDDEDLIVVNKPALLPCHPLRSAHEASVITVLARDYPEVALLGGKPFEGGLIHRLDNGTSGALMVARTPQALQFMREALRAGQIYRRYEALIAGNLNHAIELNWPIAHHRKNPARMVIADDLPLPINASRAEKIVRAPYRGTPREAFSVIEPVKRVGGFTLVNVIPRTGRRHQIRVHLAAAGTPIASDKLYGGPPLSTLLEERFWLHLAELRFDSPTGKRVCLVAPRPDDLEKALTEATIKETDKFPHSGLHPAPGQGLPQRSRKATSARGLRRTPPNLSRG